MLSSLQVSKPCCGGNVGISTKFHFKIGYFSDVVESYADRMINFHV